VNGWALPELLAVIGPRQPRRGRIVLTNGCFDLLHAGHVRFLRRARALGDALVVAVNGDASVRRLKGPHRPIQSQADRVEILAALEMVDYVTLFDEPDPWPVVEQIRPQVLVKGADWGGYIIGRDIVEADGGSVVSLPLEGGRSTTALVEGILKSFS